MPLFKIIFIFLFLFYSSTSKANSGCFTSVMDALRGLTLSSEARQLQALQRMDLTTPEGRQALREYRARTGQDLPVDPRGRSPETALAQETDASDLFGYGESSVERTVRSGRMTDTAPYNGRDYWWTDTRVPSDRSLSPNVQELVREHGARNVRRTIGWPNRTPSTQQATVPIELGRHRYALNQVLDPTTREVTEETLEVFAKNRRTGEWEPFLYEKRNGEWVQMRSFNGSPVRQACIRCHQNRAGRMSPIPYKRVPTWTDMNRIYDSPYYSPRVYDQFH